MLDVLYEDNQIIVVVKPHNKPTQADESGDEDLLNEVKNYIKEKYNKPGEAYVGLVHRLDRPTGGIMVFAKTSKAAGRLCDQIKNDEMKKTYYVVCQGKLRSTGETLVNYLKKDEKNNIVKLVSQGETGAKKAELKYKVLESKDNLHLLEVELVTGRSHQIRVQLSGIGLPVFGDTKYNKNTKEKISKNLALWAGRLEFVHPVTKKTMVFVVPPTKQAPWNKFYVDKYFLR